MKNIKIIKTQDGSLGLYDSKLDEIFHSIYGAKKEAIEKFIDPCKILDNKELTILDICYGIGYNTKCALQNFKNIKRIDCVEINEELIKKSVEFEFNEKINKIIESNIQSNELIYFYINDIRKVIKSLNQYDIIFHDGFAPHKQAEVWSEDLILKISKHLKYDGLYITYNHSKPVLNALFKAGLKIGKTIKDNKIIGTIASFNKELIKNPLNEFELGMLNTKSAITYKDSNLDLKHEEIIKNRNEEIKNSNKQTLSNYLKK